MESEKKKIVVLAGVTGAIGSALFAEYGQDESVVIYGISRKGMPIKTFLKDGVLPLKTLICSLSDSTDASELFSSIDYSKVENITYIHAMGLYPFEVNQNGDIHVENDADGDGINDEVTKLTHDAFVSSVEELKQYWQGESTFLIFGGIADKYRPAVHKSWWQTIEKVKGYMRKEVEGNSHIKMLVLNISSVMCPHEVITRPFVFTETDANQAYWLHPYKLAAFIVEQLARVPKGFSELEKFNIRPNFSPNTYYRDVNFTPRKVKELF